MSALRFERAPLRVYWELTRACDLACRHCRAEAMPQRAADELETEECERVLRSLAAAGPPAPHVIFTGGDPLKRPDLLALVRYGVGLGLGVAVAPSATPGLTRGLVHALKAAGVSAMSLSLDGPSAAQHDGMRGVLGCFGWTLAAAQRVVAAGIPLQINTLVAAATEPYLEATAEVVARLGASRWSLFFLVNVGRAAALRPLDTTDCERTLRWLARQSARWPFTVTTTEAPHYRRVLIQEMRAAGRTADEIRASPVARGFGIRDGNGVMFIAANGDVTPSGFLPLAAGNVRDVDPISVYRDAALFRALRTPRVFAGRCGICAFNAVCGGSRARAYAATGDVLGEDPLCAWSPADTAGAAA
ncbi:MAG: TIGR04053 family radical SAM/SPASM domain-containing protein [Candidatus Rokubacteria bacterium]|nr:TIGR04053 family radical SAM/SPASM domain-containing protein [Candidatus Rokubacteria bacterium]